MQFFKKYMTILGFAVGLLAWQTPVYASNLHLILGGDFVVSDVKYGHQTKTSYKYSNRKVADDFVEMDDDYKSFSPVIGLSAYGVSLEAYMMNSNEISKDSVKSKIRAYGVDFIGEAGLSDNFSVLASLGIVQYTFKTEKDRRDKDEDVSGPRVGIGLQYYLTRNIAIRGMYHYTHLNSGEGEHYKAVSEFLAGLRFIF